MLVAVVTVTILFVTSMQDLKASKVVEFCCELCVSRCVQGFVMFCGFPEVQAIFATFDNQEQHTRSFASFFKAECYSRQDR